MMKSPAQSTKLPTSELRNGSAADRAREALPPQPPSVSAEAAARRRCGGATDTERALPAPRPLLSFLPLSSAGPGGGRGGGGEAPLPRSKSGLVRVVPAKSVRTRSLRGAGVTLRERRGQWGCGGAGRSAAPCRVRRVVDLNADDAILA
jgi:hypothetical protein